MLFIDAEVVSARLTWPTLIEALRAGHKAPPPHVDDTLLSPGDKLMLVRSAWIEGLGGGVKAVTMFPANPSATPPRPAVQGAFLLFDEDRGDIAAVIDGAAITGWKTAADSALGADYLARKDAQNFAMIGAGAIAEPLVRAHLAARPGVTRVTLWNRNLAKCDVLAARLGDLDLDFEVAGNIEAAVRAADIISVATLAHQPIIKGDWLKQGAHLDLVGAFNLQMREADDVALTRGRLFADYRASAHDTGELADPISRGVITTDDLVGDHYDLAMGTCGRGCDNEITIFKNGGGAHLDLMTARAVVAGQTG